jgi:hypothetical protein
MPMPDPVLYRNKGTQCGTEMLRYRTNTGCQNADVGGIDLDVDAQLWALHKSAAEAAVAAGVMHMQF